MSRKYYQKLKKINDEGFTLFSKLNLLNELEAFTNGAKIEDSVIDKLYHAYVDISPCECIFEFVVEIFAWCQRNNIDFLEVQDYEQMIDEIWG